MSLTKVKFLSLAVLVGLQMNASASLLEPQEFDNGGLTWLTLSETTGLSISDFNNGAGSWNTKYRLARGAEVESLVQSYGIRPTEVTTQPNGRSWGYIQDVGGWNDHFFGTWWFDGSQGAIGRTLDAYVDVSLFSGDNPHPTSPSCPGYADCTYAKIDYSAQNLFAKSSTEGLFLVRRAEDAPADVPEPGTLALFGAAALAALYRRRNKAI